MAVGSVEGEANVWTKNTHWWVWRMLSEHYIIWWITSFTYVYVVIVHMHLPTAVILCWVENSFFFKSVVIDLCEYILDCLWICEWVFLILFVIECIHYTILLHLCDYIHLYTLRRFWNFWLIFKQSKYLYIGYGVYYIFWIEWNPCSVFINLRFFPTLMSNKSCLDIDVTVLRFFSLQFTSTWCSVSLPPKWQFQLSYYMGCDS